jgi:ATP-dependent helicase/nuclease subunit B
VVNQRALRKSDEGMKNDQALSAQSLSPIIRSRMIKVLIGPASSGKTQTLIARTAEALAAGRRGAHLIVPSEPAAVVLRELLSARIESPLNEAVKTFPALYHSALDYANVRGRVLSVIERGRLLGLIVSRLAQSGGFRYFAETAEMPGLIHSLSSWVEELWRSGIAPEDFARISEARGEKDRDIAQVFSRYAAALAKLNRVDAESAGHAALSALEKIAELRHRFSLIAVAGFDFLTAVQVRLLARLAARGVEALVSLTYDEARVIHAWQRPTIARLQAAGASFTTLTTAPQGVIQIAAAALMNDNESAEPVANGSHRDAGREGAIIVISAPDRAAEVRSVAREIKRLVIEERVPLDEITLVCRSLSIYAPHIERVFSECAIPLTVDDSLQVTENPAVLALLRLFNLSGQSFKRRACIEAWRSPYFDWSEFGLDEKAIDLLDAISLAENVTRGRDQWRSAVKAYGESRERKHHREEFDAEEDHNEAGRQSRYDRLAANLEAWFDALTPPARATQAAHIAWASRWSDRLRVDEAAANEDRAVRDGRALKEFESILKALAYDDLTASFVEKAEAQAAPDIAWRAFMAELERTLAAITYHRDAAERPGVVAQNARLMRPRRYRVVFVLGLIEGEFPARLTDRAPYTLVEREELRRAGLDLTETISDAGADLLHFYQVMSRATERLYLTQPRTDVAGGELLPSYLIEEVQPFVDSPVRRITSVFSNEDHEMAETCSLGELALRTARAQRRSESSSGETRSAAMVAAGRLLDSKLPSWRMTERGVAVEWRRMKAERDRHSGWINDAVVGDELKKRFGPEYLWSATQINDYGICPFRFFARHALKLDAAREPGEGFAAHHLGHAYHRILEQLYLRLREAGSLIQSPTAERAIDEAARIAEDVLQKMLDRGEVRRDGLWEFQKDEIKRRVGRLLRTEAVWNDSEPARPVDCECKFGYDGADAMVIECPGGDAKFRGIVDRLDRRDNGEWVVVDYKTRRTPIPLRDAFEGRNLQLPLYAMAASRVIKRGERIASAYYLHIHSRKRGSELSNAADASASLEALIAHAEALVRRYVEQVRGGRFPVRPNGDAVCQTCEVNVMCRIQSLRAFEDEQDCND